LWRFAIHGCSHGGLVGQCKILLYRVTVYAFTATGFTSFSAVTTITAFAAWTLVAVAFRAGFAWLTRFAVFTGWAFLACTFGATVRIAFTALAATAAFGTSFSAPLGAWFTAFRAISARLAAAFATLTTVAATTAAITASAFTTAL
jgi:hypothetical protein